MYGFQVTVVSADSGLRSQLVAELENLGIEVSGQARDVHSIAGRQDVPDNEVVLLHLPDADSIKELEALVSRMPGQPVVVLTPVEDGRWLIRCVRVGAAQIVLLPVERQELADALAQLARQLGALQVTNMVVAVTGSQGGCGSTFVACNLAGALAEIVPTGVILTDMNVNFGAVASYLDIEPRYSVLDLLAQQDHPDAEMINEALFSCSKGLKVLAAPSDAIGMRRASPQQIKALLDALRSLGHLVVLDVPCTYDAQYFTTLTCADRIVLLLEQKVPAVRALGRVVRRLHEEGFPPERILAVLNRQGTGDPDLRVEDISSATGVPIAHSIPNDYPTAAGSMNMGKLLNSYAPQHPMWQRISELARLVLKEPAFRGAAVVQTATPAPGALRRFGRAIGLAR